MFPKLRMKLCKYPFQSLCQLTLMHVPFCLATYGANCPVTNNFQRLTCPKLFNLDIIWHYSSLGHSYSFASLHSIIIWLHCALIVQVPSLDLNCLYYFQRIIDILVPFALFLSDQFTNFTAQCRLSHVADA